MAEKLDITSVSIKENSWIANAAARKMRVKSVALVIGRTIHLCNTTREEFIKNERWLKHELCHIQQYKKHGGYFFLLKYLLESLNMATIITSMNRRQGLRNFYNIQLISFTVKDLSSAS